MKKVILYLGLYGTLFTPWAYAQENPNDYLETNDQNELHAPADPDAGDDRKDEAPIDQYIPWLITGSLVFIYLRNKKIIVSQK